MTVYLSGGSQVEQLLFIANYLAYFADSLDLGGLSLGGKVKSTQDHMVGSSAWKKKMVISRVG